MSELATKVEQFFNGAQELATKYGQSVPLGYTYHGWGGRYFVPAAGHNGIWLDAGAYYQQLRNHFGQKVVLPVAGKVGFGDFLENLPKRAESTTREQFGWLLTNGALVYCTYVPKREPNTTSDPRIEWRMDGNHLQDRKDLPDYLKQERSMTT